MLSKLSETGIRARPEGISQTTHFMPTARLPVHVGVTVAPNVPSVIGVPEVTAAEAEASPTVSEVMVIFAVPDTPGVSTVSTYWTASVLVADMALEAQVTGSN